MFNSISENFNILILWIVIPIFKQHKDIPFTSMSSRGDDDESFEDTLQDDLDIIDFLESEFQFKQIEQAMQDLDNDSRELIYLKFIESKDNNEISEIL